MRRHTREAATVDFELNQRDRLDAIVVTGRAPRPRSASSQHRRHDRRHQSAERSDREHLGGTRRAEPGVPYCVGGLTGEGARIRIRGITSLSQANEPIVYIDGVRVIAAAARDYIGPAVAHPRRGWTISSRRDRAHRILKGAAAATLSHEASAG